MLASFLYTVQTQHWNIYLHIHTVKKFVIFSISYFLENLDFLAPGLSVRFRIIVEGNLLKMARKSTPGKDPDF